MSRPEETRWRVSSGRDDDRLPRQNGGDAVTQQGQVFPLTSRRTQTRWAYRYRVGGRGSRRVQRGGFESEHAASAALERALERVRRERGLVEAPRLSELVGVYLAQH